MLFIYLVFRFRSYVPVSFKKGKKLKRKYFFQRALSDKNQVTLENLNLNSAGQYRCEISAEAPLFNTVAQSKKLNVIGIAAEILQALTSDFSLRRVLKQPGLNSSFLYTLVFQDRLKRGS